jgi:hypothetical protein
MCSWGSRQGPASSSGAAGDTPELALPAGVSNGTALHTHEKDALRAMGFGDAELNPRLDSEDLR